MTGGQFWLRGSVIPQDQTNFPQQIGIDLTTGDLYLTQSEDSGSGFENLTISRFVNFTFASMMTGLQGHGTPLLVEHQGTTTYLTFPYRGATGGDHWVRLPFMAGKVWTAAEVLSAQYAANPLPSHPPAATNWMQGEAEFEEYLFRLVGGPFNDNGPTMDGGPAEVEIIRNGAITGLIDASMLGRQGMVSTGAPINHRLEPEGLASWPIQSAPVLVVGVANGRADNHSLLVNLYAYSLDRASFVSDDAPPSMPTGTTLQVHVTMRNTGYTTWIQGRHFLGEGRWVDPTAEQPVWGQTFYSIDNDVPPGQEVTFSCAVTATSPVLDRQWWMVRDPAFPGTRYYFGEQSARVHIALGQATDCESLRQQVVALQEDLTDLTELLERASTGAKAAIVVRMYQVQASIDATEAQLRSRGCDG